MRALTAVTLLAIVALAAADVTNPCASSSGTCGRGTSSDRCGYGSVCVGTSLSSGTCQYLSATLGCGAQCGLINGTSFSAVYPSTTICGTGGCTKVASTDTFGTCGLPNDHFAPAGCACSSSSTYQTCESDTCASSVCSLSGKNRGAWGYPCSQASDCVSNICTNSVCVGVQENAACAFDGQCGKGFTCAGTGPAKTCVAFLAINAACSASSTKCVPYGLCDTAAGRCVKRGAASAGSVCTSSRDCNTASGLACIAGVCSTSASCDSALGSSTCKYGQYCGCSGGNPVCMGDAVSSGCTSAVQDYEQCIFENAAIGRMDGAVAMNYIPTPTACNEEFRSLYCDRACAGPDSALGRDPLGRINLDYSLIDCTKGEWKSYSSSQTAYCSRSYCPTAFNAANTAAPAAAAVLALAAVATVARRLF